MRLFAAVLPPRPVLDHLERALVSVRGGTDPQDSRGALRWTPDHQRHLTLAFYGEVPDGSLEDLVSALSAVARTTDPFAVSLRGAGLFDRRTLWIGCAGDTQALTALTARAVRVGVDLYGRQDSHARSRAHLTVARVAGQARARDRRSAVRSARTDASARGGVGAGEQRGGTAEVAAMAHALALYDGPSWTVSEIAVVSSRLGAGPSGHPQHDVRARLPLALVAG